MATRKSTPKNQLPKDPLLIRSHTLSRSSADTLERLSHDASDLLGWSVSQSAVIRALLQYVKQQPASWAAEHLHPLIEQELVAGRVWGHRRK